MDAAAEEHDPGNFDSSAKNDDEIDLPVFTCSARDYVRLTGQIKGDGDPSCFSNVKDTGIPALQEWCHRLTVSSYERAARKFLNHLKAFATTIQSYVKGIGDVTMIDRERLQEKWESSEDRVANFLVSDDEPPLQKLDANGESAGITTRLTKDFGEVVKNNAAKTAVRTSDSFADGIHWCTYRATLLRHGSFHKDLNIILLAPFSCTIVSSWGKVFETDLLASFHKAADEVINKLVREVEESAPPGLVDCTKTQAEVCLNEAKLTMEDIIKVVHKSLKSEQKEISHCLTPHVRCQLAEGYDEAMEEEGQGSVACQKLVFHKFIYSCRDGVFEGGAKVILKRLSKAAEAVGQALNDALQSLAKKIEVNLAVLWEAPKTDPGQIRTRQEVVYSVTKIIQQVELWEKAEAQRMIAD